MSGSLLAIRALTAGYGATPIIEEIALEVAPREIAVVIGPNGAGKSTLLRSVFGLTRVLAGDIRFRDRSILGLRTASLVPLGIAAVPQTRNVFASLSVRENLEIGTYAAGTRSSLARLPEVLGLFPDLAAKLGQPAGELSGGQRQMVAFGRALMSAPELLLLDEPTAGLSPAYLERIFDLILAIRQTGVTVLMVEQNARQALRIADHAHVLVNGRNFRSGPGPVIAADQEVRRSFLGGGAPA